MALPRSEVLALLVVIALSNGVYGYFDDEDLDKFDCPAQFGYFADPNNCIKYYICDGPNTRRVTCQIRKNIVII